MAYELPKGTRDLLPKEKIVKNQVVDTLRRVFERYGFNPIETPCMQTYDAMTAKSGALDDAANEMYTFTDRGERKLGLRYEFTFPLCRMVCEQMRTLQKPFKRYEMGPCWRDGPVKLGRFREFWQCDVDTVGADVGLADAELLALAYDVAREAKLDIVIELNNRKILRGIMEAAGVPEDKIYSAIIALDKYEKVGMEGVRAEMEDDAFEPEVIEKLFDIVLVEGTNDEKIAALAKVKNKDMQDGLEETKLVLQYAQSLGVPSDAIEFTPTMARGLGYYTGPIFEAFFRKSNVKVAIAGGGRYDNSVGTYFDGKTRVPATGISFGLDTIITAMGESDKRSVARVYVVPFKQTIGQALTIAQQLRNNGINVDVDLSGKNIGKAMDYADSYAIPFVVIVGPKDIENNEVTVRDMVKGEDKKVKIASLSGYF